MTTSTPPRAETPIQQALEVLSQDTVRLARAWQDGLAALVDGYSEQLRRFAALATGGMGMGLQDDGAWPRVVGRITDATRQLTDAQSAVAREWLRAPFWLTDTAAPLDLQAAYVRLFEASRELTAAYVEAALGWQRALTASSERAAETLQEAVDVQTQTARRLANDAREAQQATVDATRSTVSAVRETTNRTVTQAVPLPNGAPTRADRRQ